jgi:hypothetical protein
MKRIIVIALTLALLAIGSTSQAYWTGSVYNDQLNSYVPNIQVFDWSSSGSGLATGLGPAGSPLVVGTTFDFLYQAELVGVNDPVGNPVAFPGLSSTFEYTAVALIPEVVTAVIPLSPTITQVIFTSLAGATFHMWHDGPGNVNDPAPPRAPNSDVLSGFGFDDGDTVAYGTIGAGQITTFLFDTATGQGIGSTILNGLVTDASPWYLEPDAIIFDLRFEAQINQPPLDSLTYNFFTGVEAGAYAPYAVNYGPDGIPGTADDIDTIFKVDGSSRFSVPEPSTMILFGAALIGIAAFSRKRSNKK